MNFEPAIVLMRKTPFILNWKHLLRTGLNVLLKTLRVTPIPCNTVPIAVKRLRNQPIMVGIQWWKEKSLKTDTKKVIGDYLNAARDQTSKRNRPCQLIHGKSQSIFWEYRVAKKDNKPEERTWHTTSVQYTCCLCPKSNHLSLLIGATAWARHEGRELNSYQLSILNHFFHLSSRRWDF